MHAAVEQAAQIGSSEDTGLVARRVRSLLPAATVKALSKASEWRAVTTIVMQYALVAGAIALSEWSNSWTVTVLAIVFIATRQHAIAIMMHDAAHFLLSRRRWLNDAISNLLCSFPFFVSTARYRASHLSHHRNANGDDDPDLDDNVHPETVRELAVMIAKDLTFLSLPKQLRRGRKFGAIGIFTERGTVFVRERAMLAVYLLAVGGLVWWSGTWRDVLLYWYLPFFTVCQAILRFRGFSEHAGRMEGTFLTGSRTIAVGFAERVLFAPCNVNRHLEHHLYPSVPQHNLEVLSGELRKNADYARTVAQTDGYLRGPTSVFGELYGRPNAPTGATATA